MHLALAMFSLAVGSVPSAGLVASFASGMDLTLASDDTGPPPGSPYPPPPPLVPTPPLPKVASPDLSEPEPPPPIFEGPDQTEPPPPATAYPPPPLPQLPRALVVPESPPAEAGSIAAAFWESSAADLGLRLVFEGVAFFFFAVADLQLNPPCGGTPDVGAGIALMIPAVAALIGQPFAIAGIVGAIFHAHGRHPKYWTSFGADVLTTLVIAPLAGFLIGEIIANTGSNSSGPAAGVGVTVFALVGAFGAPMGGYLSLPPPSHPAAPTARALGVPLLRLSFN